MHCRRLSEDFSRCAPGGLPLFDGGVIRRVGGPRIVCAGAYEAVVVVLFDDVGCPSGDAADGEDGGEEIDVDTEGGVG